LTDTFDKRLGQIKADSGIDFAGGRKGIEKESLRIDSAGYLSRTPHPQGLGSALTNRYITTDFSEALLEFVTPAYRHTWEALRAVCDIHQFTYANLGDELLWVASMPCRIPDDADIPLARYGDSNVGQMKTIYRRGLGHRYGRQMQTIAGVHFNYSLPESFWTPYAELLGDTRGEDEFRSDQYLAMVRNIRRLGWLILYLYGASPALCKSFAGDDHVNMSSFNEETWYEPFGTSLRMSDLGYNNQTQSRLNISLNDIDRYVEGLTAATRTPEPAYEQIGVKVDGIYRQLNTNELQIENEYYSPVRPKRVAHSGERPTAALRRGGIEYVEIRSLDINVFDPCGVNQNTMRFIEAFLVYCLLEDSPLFDDDGLEEAKVNQLETARRGRDPELKMRRNGVETTLPDWANQILDGVTLVAEAIDNNEGGDDYRGSVEAARKLVADADATPSARILDELRTENCSFFEFALAMSKGHSEYFRSITALSESRQEELANEARDSIARQCDIEASDEIDIDEYLAQYFATD
jgi:glutamate--cysteine ligase